MAHTTEIVKYEKLSNGQFAVTIRCCANPATDHAHTVAAELAGDGNKLAASLSAAREFCAAQHENAEKAAAALLGEVGKQKEHA